MEKYNYPQNSYELTVRLGKSDRIYDFNADEYINISLNDFPERSDFGIIFNKCNFEHGFNFVGGERPNCKIIFSNCSFGEDEVNQLAVLELSSLTFQDCKFGKLGLTNVQCKHIRFVNCTFTNLDFYDSSIKKLFIQEPSENRAEVFIGAAQIEYCSLMGDFKKVILNEFQVCNLVGNYNLVQLDSESFEKCYFGNSNSLPKRSKIDQLNFFTKAFQGDIYIHNMDLHFFEWSGVSSSRGSLRMNDVSVEYFRLKNSTINYLEWSNLRLINYSLGGSNLFGLKVFNVTWPKDKLFEQILPDLPQWKFLSKRQKAFLNGMEPAYKAEMEAYRLLKVSSQINQNELDALEFYRLEMRRLWVIRRISKSNSWMNDALLGTGRLVSDFGQNWLFPLAWLFGIHYLMFMSIFEWKYTFEWESFKNGLGSFFELLNPVHKTPDYINTGMGLFTEFWMRVLGGFFIYHFIRATRKYGKN